MSACPFNNTDGTSPLSPALSPPRGEGGGAKLRAGLPPLTPRFAALPMDERGYPVPFFVQWVDGKPDFRIMDGAKLVRCVKERLCWTCGQPLGRWLAFVIGPMCTVTRTTSEPASHRDCAEWSVLGCPFLSRPNMVRREDELTESCVQAGHGIKRNPGVIAVWMTKEFKLFRDAKGGVLFSVGAPESVSWWREGRSATRAEVVESVMSGLPLLADECRSAGELKELEREAAVATRWFPPD